ncbi:MAG: hypothetical protein RLZZ127_2331 [Planctomycetota bacterium]|jgi:DNA-binding IclR family transcriptional regulator
MGRRTATLSTLRRAVRVLEAVAGHPDASTSALAVEVGMPPSSVSRILTVWRERGYVDQAGRRAAWRLGPRCLALGLSGRSGDLVLAAEPSLRRLHERWGCGIVLAVRRGIHRINVISFTPRPGTRSVVVESDDLVDTATGRLLLAAEPRRLRRTLCSELGLPGTAWPQAVDTRELEEQLDEIAADGRCEVRTRSWWAMARLVPGPQGPTAVGAYLPLTASAAQRARIDRALAALVRRLALPSGGLRRHG